MGLQVFRLESLDEMDPSIGIEIDRHIRRVAHDCLDRPGDTKARIVTLKISVVPVSNQRNECDRVELDASVTSSVPLHRSMPFSLGARNDGTLFYNIDSLDNVRQTTLIPDPGEVESA